MRGTRGQAARLVVGVLAIALALNCASCSLWLDPGEPQGGVTQGEESGGGQSGGDGGQGTGEGQGQGSGEGQGTGEGQGAPPEDTPTTEPTCASLTGEQAVNQSIHLVSPPFADDPSIGWAYADFTTYDPCAVVSWSVLSTQGTAASPCQIMLFNRGVFVAQATTINYPFHPEVVRVSDDTIQVTYTYLQPGESTAQASGKATATFTWNESLERFDVGGYLPPS